MMEKKEKEEKDLPKFFEVLEMAVPRCASWLSTAGIRQHNPDSDWPFISYHHIIQHPRDCKYVQCIAFTSLI
jgi:hypothetical protein